MTSVQSSRSSRAASLPPALESVLALAGGSSGTARSFLAPDAETWLADPEQGLTAAIGTLRGPAEAGDELARMSPSSLTVVGAVESNGACWAEITGSGGGEPETCIVGLTYDGHGAVSRLVWVSAPFVPVSGVDEQASAPDARPVLEGYFADLMNSRFEAAAAHFTADAIYSHPPYSCGAERVLFRGRDALSSGLVTRRGPSPARQVITDCWQRSSRVFVEGVIEGIPNGGTFFSTAQISPGGEIARYVAFYSATRIPACR
jgi:hypothetical protein